MEDQLQKQFRWGPTRRQLLWAFCGVVAALALVISLYGGYRYGWEWTGIVEDDNYPKRTLWDWLKLLIIPLVLAAGGVWFNHQQREHELRIAAQQRERDQELEQHRSRDTALQAYLDQIGVLLLKENLRTSQEGDEVATLARARTLSVLSQLDGNRKRALVRFLAEAGLIQGRPGMIGIGSGQPGWTKRRPVVGLTAADLSDADLSDTDLSYVILGEANLRGANLQRADLTNAVLFDADLTDADLLGTVVTWEQLSECASLEGATMPGGQTKYEDWVRTNKDWLEFQTRLEAYEKGRQESAAGEDGENSGPS